MEKPDFKQIAEELKKMSEDLASKEGQPGNSKIIFAFAKMIFVMGWSSSQQDTNNIQIANLTDEIKQLKDITDENAKSSEQNTSSTQMWSTVAIIVAIISGFFTYQSVQLAKSSIDLSADAVLEIIPDDTMYQKDEVSEGIGMISAASSTLRLRLINRSAPTISDIDIRMSLWYMDRAKSAGLFMFCPLGYVDHTENPEFKVTDLKTFNVLNKKLKLKHSEFYNFYLDYKNLQYVDIWERPLSSDAAAFLKIDISYRKEVTQVKESYTKIYRIFNDQSVIDVDTASDFGYAVAVEKILSRENPHDLPNVFYPFQNREFLDYVQSLRIPDSFIFRECDEFKVTNVTQELSY